MVAGGGLGFEVVAGFATWLDRAGIGPLSAEVFTDNPASRRVLEKAGFRLSGEGMGVSAARAAPAPIKAAKPTAWVSLPTTSTRIPFASKSFAISAIRSGVIPSRCCQRAGSQPSMPRPAA